MSQPLVTVICLCYNQERFVREAIESVFTQTYSPIQLIVVDDASTDGSVHQINNLIESHAGIQFLSLKKNAGNCRAFNKGLELARGKYVIDLAADDVLMPHRVQAGMDAFAHHDSQFGVNFSDVELIDESGKHLGYHSDRYPHHSIPQGDIYKHIIGRYFINSPSMMIRKEVMDKLSGYDESLAYEDFDFLIRASRDFKLCYTPEALLKRRIVTRSMSRNQYKKGSLQLLSTFMICQKIEKLNRTEEERSVFKKRVLYETRKALQVGEMGLAFRYMTLFLS